MKCNKQGKAAVKQLFDEQLASNEDEVEAFPEKKNLAGALITLCVKS